MKKTGELTSTQIITAVITIFSFLAILLFFLTPDLIGQSDEEICRLSILTRATSPEAFQKQLPLKCTTKKICLTTGSDCTKFTGEENVQKIKLSNSRTEESAKKIEETVANAMFDCWSITGQGKLDLFGDELSIKDFLNLNDKGPSCIICSRIAISKDLQENSAILEKVDVNNYMQTQKVPGSSLTYLQTLTDRQVNSLPSEINQELAKPENQKRGTDQIAIVFSQIRADDIEDEFISGATAGAGVLLTGTYALGTFGTAITTFKHPILTFGSAILLVAGTGGLKAYGASKHQDIAAVYCGQFSSSEQNKRGCSIVTQANYNNIDSINKLCAGGIEGNP